MEHRTRWSPAPTLPGVFREAPDELASKIPVHPTDRTGDELVPPHLVEAFISRA